MPYFDSQKNRALWAKELAELKKEKEARKAGKARAREEAAEERERETVENNMQVQNVYRERTSYKELLIEEQQSINARRAERMTSKQLDRSSQMDMDMPSANPM